MCFYTYNVKGDNMGKDFKNICKKDIEEMLKIINVYLPDLEEWNLEQSAIFEDDKRIICKSVKDNKNNKLGYDIRIHITDDNNSFYHFRYMHNNVFLIKKTWNNDKVSTEGVCVLLNNNEITRIVKIQSNEKIALHEKKYNINNKMDLQAYLNSESFQSIIADLKVNRKERKRN